LTTYQFEAQLRKGEAYEAVLDNFFREKFDIQPVQMCDQRRGIDRIFTSKKNGSILKIEYKADSKAAQTGNAFIETVSVDTQQKPGWAVYSEADYLIYYIPPQQAQRKPQAHIPGSEISRSQPVSGRA